MSMKELGGNLLPLAVACKAVANHIWSLVLMIVVLYCSCEWPLRSFCDSHFESSACTSTSPLCLLPFSAGEFEGPLCSKNLCPCQQKASSVLRYLLEHRESFSALVPGGRWGEKYNPGGILAWLSRHNIILSDYHVRLYEERSDGSINEEVSIFEKFGGLRAKPQQHKRVAIHFISVCMECRLAEHT